MQIKFNFHQVDPSPSLRTYIQDALEKAGRHLLTDSHVTVFCRQGRFDCQVQVEVSSPWGHFQASERHKDFYVAADGACGKLERQFHKTKDRHQHHRKPLLAKSARLQRVNEALEYDDSLLAPMKKVG